MRRGPAELVVLALKTTQGSQRWHFQGQSSQPGLTDLVSLLVTILKALKALWVISHPTYHAQAHASEDEDADSEQGHL